MSRVWSVVGALCVLLSVAAAAPVPAKNAALDAQFRADVERASPEAAHAYDQGNAARDAGRPDEAAAAYRKAIELAPKVDHPHRRLCGVLTTEADGGGGVAECEAALALAPTSGWDKAGLATALLSRNRTGDLERATRLAREAVDAHPDESSVLQTWCLALIRAQDEIQFRGCVTSLIAVDPDGMLANYFAGILAAQDNHFADARRHLDKAKAAGLPPAGYEALEKEMDRVDDANATVPAWARHALPVALWGTGAWLAVMVLLFLAGAVLSRLTLRTVAHATATGANAAGSARERRLRHIYKAVLLLSGVCFYASVPIMLGTIIAAGCGLILLFVSSGTIPVKLVLLIAVVVIATVGAILRSLFVRPDRKAPGERLDLAKEPALRALLDDVAATTGTRAVDVAYVTPGTDMAVMESGGLWASLRGARTERSLIMGVGLFDGMTQLQLRSILAHEYGHFCNEDTAGGGFALAVRRSLYAIIIRLARSGVAAVWNPVWWFLRGYHRVYLGISQGASRLQEVLADRKAIQSYGSPAFVAAYRHVVERSTCFPREVGAAVDEVVKQERPLPNLYRYELEAPPKADLAAEIEKAMTREPTLYDSHPSSRQRIAWAEQLAVPRDPQAADDAPVWNLFADRDALERAMTGEICDRVYKRTGVKILVEAPTPVPALAE